MEPSQRMTCEVWRLVRAWGPGGPGLPVVLWASEHLEQLGDRPVGPQMPAAFLPSYLSPPCCPGPRLGSHSWPFSLPHTPHGISFTYSGVCLSHLLWPHSTQPQSPPSGTVGSALGSPLPSLHPQSAPHTHVP